jgi:asparagine synthase (glutamine-hydrolysing)
MPWEVRSVLDATTVRAGLQKLQILEKLEATAHGLRQPHARIAALELSWYMRNQLLRDADWAGMAHSLEIRVPLLDVPLFRALAPLMVSGGCPTKLDVAHGLPRSLPNDVTSRAKSGFVTPVEQWLLQSSGARNKERGLRQWAKRVLPSQPRIPASHSSPRAQEASLAS